MQNFRALGAPPPDPQPPAANGFATRPPLASGGWGFRLQIPKHSPPNANFWLRSRAGTYEATSSTAANVVSHLERF